MPGDVADLLLVTPRWEIEEAYGGEISARLLRDRLEEDGWSVRVVTQDAGAAEPGVRECSLSTWAILSEIRDFEPDVLHCYNMEAAQASLLAAKLGRVPSLVTVNSYWATCLWGDMTFPSGELCQGCSLSGIRRDYAERDPATVGREVPTPLARAEVARRVGVVRRFDGAVALSEASRGQLVKGGLDPDHVGVVPNMVDPRDLSASLPDLPDEKTVLFVGQLKHTKGVDDLIDGFGRIVDEEPAARLRIAGKGPRREAMEASIREQGLEEQVAFLGHVDPERLREIYRSSRVVVMPTVWIEPFGRVVLEAWGHGSVLCVSDRGGPGEVVEDGETGRVFPARDPQALAGSLLEVLRDDELASRLRANAKEHLSDYRPGAVVDQYKRAYRRRAGLETDAPTDR